MGTAYSQRMFKYIAIPVPTVENTLQTKAEGQKKI